MFTDELQFRNTAFNNGWNTFKSGMGNLFGGIASFSNAVTYPIWEAGCQLQNISMTPSYQMTNAMRCYGYPHWGWFPPSVFYTPPMYYNYQPLNYGYQPMAQPQSNYTPCNCNGYSNYNFYAQNPNPANEFQVLDEILHPERLNQGASSNTTGTTSKTSDFIDTRNIKGEKTTPNWYENIKHKKEKSEKITQQEEQLYKNYNFMNEKYSLYQLDKDKKIVTDSDGKPIESNFYRKLQNLHVKLQSDDAAGIERMLNSASAEELAAMEAMYPVYLDVLRNKGNNEVSAITLREAIRDACLATGFGWTGYNTECAERMFDKLDSAAMYDPRAMANALHQTIKNHHSIAGLTWGIDDNRIAKLLKMTEQDTEFREAALEMYEKIAGTSLSSDISSSWTISSENRDIIGKYL